jgi:N4-(beta-N-acetylglucosaminyl)-L-asparaginase
MTDRRSFLRSTALGAALGPSLLSSCTSGPPNDSGQPAVRPVALSTWSHGLAANEVAWPVLMEGGSSLDAVEAGAPVTEADPTVTSVGYGGFPDRFGRFTRTPVSWTSEAAAGRSRSCSTSYTPFPSRAW